jgi:LacI family gluconate utilization system Gnt-I transcriptional repressor
LTLPTEEEKNSPAAPAALPVVTPPTPPMPVTVAYPPPRRARRGSGKATLVDVAALARMSTQTVSRVINCPAQVPPATLALVRAAIEKVGYVPNLLAGGLASGRSRLVAALVPAIGGPVFLQTIEALAQTLGQRGYQLMLGESGYEQPDEAEVLQNIISRRPDGIVLTRLVLSEAARSRLAASGLPVVETWDLTDRPVDMLIGFSHEGVGVAVADFFAQRGFRSAGLLCGNDPRALRRGDAFAARLRQLGVLAENAPLPTVMFPAPAPLGAGRRALGDLLAAHPATDAVFCSTDMVALGALVEAGERGLRVPQDLAVMGFGDLAFAADTAPALTTVRIDGATIGQRAAQWIMHRAEGMAVPEQRLDLGFEIIRRGSA